MKVPCPKCKTRLTYEPGKQVQCSGCGKTLQMPPVEKLPPDAQDEYIMEGVNAKEEPPPLKQAKSTPPQKKERRSSSPKPASHETRGSTEYPALGTFATACQNVAVVSLIAGVVAILVGLVFLISGGPSLTPSPLEGASVMLLGGVLLFEYYMFRAIADLIQLLVHAAGDLQKLRQRAEEQDKEPQ